MDYIIAGHRIRLTGEGSGNAFAKALRPFRVPENETGVPVLTLLTGCPLDLQEYD